MSKCFENVIPRNSERATYSSILLQASGFAILIKQYLISLFEKGLDIMNSLLSEDSSEKYH